MADNTTKHPTYPRPDRPLYTPDADAQRQVVERIEQGRGGRRERNKPPQVETDSNGVVHLRLTPPRPMGQHPYISRDVIAQDWGVGHTKAGELLKHPEDMDPFQVDMLCRRLGVTLEWLRGYDEVNTFGLYETPDTVAAIYERLPPEDRALVYQLLTRLAGADVVKDVRYTRHIEQHKEWYKHHPQEREHMEALAQSIYQPIADMFARMRASLPQYTDEEYQLMEQAADKLEAQGIDTSEISAAQLLDIARADFVELERESPS